MKNAVKSSASASSWRQEGYPSFDFVQAVWGFVGLVGVRYRSLCFQRFSFQYFSFTHIPISPPSSLRQGYDRQAGPTQWLFQGPPAENKLLAV
jgi:hypothetical protein